jgi:hypothetical protein
MIRSENVTKGDIYTEPVSGAKVEVVDIRGWVLLFNIFSALFSTSMTSFFFSIWEEEEESGGNGCDCIVRIRSSDDIGTFLRSNGSVPIPPYLHREAVAGDKVSQRSMHLDAFVNLS